MYLLKADQGIHMVPPPNQLAPLLIRPPPWVLGPALHRLYTCPHVTIVVIFISSTGNFVVCNDSMHIDNCSCLFILVVSTVLSCDMYLILTQSKTSDVWRPLIAKNMGLKWCASLLTQLLSCIPRRMAGMVSNFLCYLKSDLGLILKGCINAESLRLLSLNDNRFVRYFKGHLDRSAIFMINDSHTFQLS